MAIYKDIDFALTKNDSTGIDFKENINAISQSIKNIIFTIRGEHVWDPLFGSGIKNLIFEKVNMINAMRLKDEIEFSLGNYEPRINILEINVTPLIDDNEYDININYEILQLRLNETLNLKVIIQ